MKEKCKYSCFLLGLGLALLTGTTHGQGGVGLSFLKIGIGARQAGMGGVFTGVGDDIYTLYWNPGGLGHLRRWQWSADYNQWFNDIYQTSITGVKQFRVLGSRKASLGLGCTYIGMPPWDATGGKEDPVSASHFVANVSLGQRLDWISRALAVGVNLKGIESRLASYSAIGIATDIGILLKSDRFELNSLGLGIFDYGIVSLGAAVFHVGNQMKFDVEASSLPRTWRTGISLRMGRYRGWNLLLASDFIGVKHRDWVVGFGAEVWWRDVLGMRLGYRANRKDLGDFSFGFGFRWDDVINSLFGLPTRFGDAFELNLADVSYGEALHQTYRGSISHYSVAPEPFDLEEPVVVSSQVLGESSHVTLNWEKAMDPDPFDQVSYLIMVDKNRSKVEQAIKQVEKNMSVFLGSSSFSNSLLVSELLSSTSYVTPIIEGGVYYWAVAAYDLDQHARLAKRGKQHVDQFIVSTPDLLVREVIFIPNPWITTTPEQGTLYFVIANEGNGPSDSCRFAVEDVFFKKSETKDTLRQQLLVTDIPGMAPGEATTLKIPWTTEYQGLHFINTIVDPGFQVKEINKKNNLRIDPIVSIPKGEILAPDSIEVMATEYDSTEIPVVPEVYFDPHSSQIDDIYYIDREIFPSILGTLAERLRNNSGIILKVMGSIDALSGEKDSVLADERAENVKFQLISLGVPANQVVVLRNHPQKVLGRRRRPTNPQDAEWIMEQNRVVTFEVNKKDEVKIFKPIKVAVDTSMRDSVQFSIRILTSAGIRNWELEIEPGSIEVNKTNLGGRDRLWGDFAWDGTDQDGNLVFRNHWYRYSLFLTDTLDRTFKTQTDSIYLREKRTVWKREVFSATKFARVEPVYQFYWDRLIGIAKELGSDPTFRLRFEGNACAIGPSHVNDRLSYRRALRFTEVFMDRLRKTLPDQYEIVKRRISKPVGFGERDPLRLKLRGQKKILLGDNNSPVGRYLNRRIMVLLYREH